VDHVVTAPVESYSNGVLYDPVFAVSPTHVDNETGTFKAVFTTLNAPSFNGSGTIFNMTFQVLRDGECSLYFDTTSLSDRSGRNITHQIDDGYFYRPGVGKVPMAQFDFQPDPAVVSKSTVFNATASYDQDTNGNISLYFWDFGDGILENTTVPVITHNYANTGTYHVELSVLDDQGEGSQSKATQTEVQVVIPNPVADFTFWPGKASGNPPGPAALGKIVTFDGSMSYDPDPDGKVEKFTWDFGDGNVTETPNKTITHTYLALPPSANPYYEVMLIVTDSENLTSQDRTWQVFVVGLRDIDLMDITVSSSDFKQGEEVVVGVTVANRGHADETFNVTAYYNHTATEWTKIASILEDNLNGQNKSMQGEIIPIKWELTDESSPENNINNGLRKLLSGTSNPSDDTRVRVGTDSGNWTINPNTINTENSSSTLVLGTPLSTGGWILEDLLGGAKIINGEFSAGQWRFVTRLFATQDNAINATIWVRILKSISSDPQAEGVTVTLIKDWTPLFTDTLLGNVSGTLSGDIVMPSITLSNEYLYVEFQLEITQNLANSSTTEVIFQLGGAVTTARGQIWPTTFTQHKKYNLRWETGNVPPGNYVILVNASEITHEANTANNDATSGLVNVDVEIVPLEVIIDVGTIHFNGEIAEFYVLTSRSGRRSNASLEATLFFDGMQLKEFTPEDIISVSKGIYLILYTIPTNATSGTYALVVDASLTVAGTTATLAGTSLKSFHISQTLDGWNAKLIKMEGDIGTINTGIGEIKVNLTEIQATLVDVQGTVAIISSTIGTFETELSISGEVVAVSGDVAEIKGSLDNIATSLGEVQSTTTLGIAAAVILAAIAAIAAIIILLRKK